MAFNIADASVRITAQTAGEAEVAQLTKRLQDLGAETRKANQAQVIGMQGDGQRRASMVMLGQQIGDVGMQMQMGTSMAMIFAQQAGQTGYALAGMGGKLGAVGGFLAGPWGAALTVGISMLGMFISKLGDTEAGLDKVKFSSNAMGEAQGILGNIMDITTGKINTQVPALLALARAQLLVARIQAQSRQAEARSSVEGIQDRGFQVSGGMGGGFSVGRRPTDARDFISQEVLGGRMNANDAVQRLDNLRRAGRLTPDEFTAAASAVANFAVEAENIKVFDSAEQLLNGTGGRNVLRPARATRTRTPRERKARAEPENPYIDASASLQSELAQMKARTSALQQYGERLESTKEIQVRVDIATGKYAKSTEKEREELIKLAQAVDAEATARKAAADAVRDAKTLENARVDWAAEAAGLRDVGLELTMSSFQYQQYTRRKQRLVQIEQEVAALAEPARANYRNEAVAALDASEAIERYNEAKANTFAGGKDAAIKSYGDEIADVGSQAFGAWTNALQGTEDALVSFVTTGKLGFKDLATSIIGDITRIAIRQAIMKPLLGALGLKIPGFADGGAFIGGVQKFANGGVVSSPTLFPMAKGAGLMGEAGPEAIMPLKRLANGRLGVEAGGGGGNNIVVNVNVEDGQSQVSGDPGSAGALGKVIANAVRNELVVQKRPGGLLAA